jgi:hypothetical protein
VTYRARYWSLRRVTTSIVRTKRTHGICTQSAKVYLAYRCGILPDYSGDLHPFDTIREINPIKHRIRLGSSESRRPELHRRRTGWKPDALLLSYAREPGGHHPQLPASRKSVQHRIPRQPVKRVAHPQAWSPVRKDI